MSYFSPHLSLSRTFLIIPKFWNKLSAVTPIKRFKVTSFQIFSKVFCRTKHGCVEFYVRTKINQVHKTPNTLLIAGSKLQTIYTKWETIINVTVVKQFSYLGCQVQYHSQRIVKWTKWKNKLVITDFLYTIKRRKMFLNSNDPWIN